MARIYSRIDITQPPDVVYEYVTTPGHWPDWHPSSLSVRGATDHSLAVGEQVEEAYRVAGRRGRVVWTVREREAPRRWIIDATGDAGVSGTVAYTLTPHATDAGTSTHFEREFTYPQPNGFASLLEQLVLRPRIERESDEALRRLKARLESLEPAFSTLPERETRGEA